MPTHDKNPLAPYPAPDGRDRIREGYLLFSDPPDLRHPRGIAWQPGIEQGADREESKQTGRRPQHSRLGPATHRLQPQIGPQFLEGRFDRPPARIEFDNLV